MKRRDFLIAAGTVGVSACLTNGQKKEISATKTGNNKLSTVPDSLKLTPPPNESIQVAFLISNGATIIDFCGPWEVFQDVSTPDPYEAFSLYTVSETLDPIASSAGMKIIPNHTYETAPTPKVVVIPAQGGSRSPASFAWLKKVSETADVVMSVCTGAFILAQSGLIDGKKATTHHDFFDSFAKKFPQVELHRGERFVENPKFSSAGGLTSGIDMALRVVERYYGREVAEKTAFYMEYKSKDWIV